MSFTLINQCDLLSTWEILKQPIEGDHLSFCFVEAVSAGSVICTTLFMLLQSVGVKKHLKNDNVSRIKLFLVAGYAVWNAVSLQSKSSLSLLLKGANLTSILVAFYLDLMATNAVPLASVLLYWITQLICNALLGYVVSTGIAATVFILEYFFFPYTDPTKSDIISNITFSWMNAIITKTYKSQSLSAKDLPQQPDNVCAEPAYISLKKAWDETSPSLTRALMKAFGVAILKACLFEVTDDLLSLLQPQLLKHLIGYFNSNEPAIFGVAIALAMFVNSVLQTALYNQFFIGIFSVGLEVKGALISLIYGKTLKVSSKVSTGQVVNMASVDVMRVQRMAQQVQTAISAPLKLVLCIMSLYSLLGKSTIAALVTMAIMMPLNTVLAKTLRQNHKTQMELKDRRTKAINDILTSIKSIKAYAWESSVLEKVSHLRNDLELKNLAKIGILMALVNFSWFCVPFLVSCSTFATFVLINDKPLTADIVFPALALFNLLGEPILAVPALITAAIETNVALGRLSKFLLGEEVDGTVSNGAIPQGALAASGDFSWSKPIEKQKYYDEETSIEAPSTVLKGLNFHARPGELVCVVGKVGAGKSAFLKVLLGELSGGTVQITGSVAYCAQVPFITNASVKENILFGHKFEQVFYEETLSLCQLTPDLASLPDGDDTLVGEKGISLSGGQKARLSLARAVYARADVYILDDILSAVDTHVAEKLVKGVLGPDGLLKSTTRVLATNSTLLLHCSTVINLEHGRMTEIGKVDTPNFSKLPSPTISFSSSVSSPKERSEKGSVKWSVYQTYAKACTYSGTLLFLMLIIMTTLLSVLGNFWLKHWTENTGSSKALLIGVYAAFGFGSGLANLARTVCMYVFCSIKASRKLHDSMSLAVVRSPMSFFETTPVGRILNRFTNDINKVDETIPRTFGGFFSSCVKAAFTIGIIGLTMPIFLVIIMVLSIVYVYYQRYYIATSRELERIASTSRSPIFAHIQETLNGNETIRAYNHVDRFCKFNNEKVDFNLKALYFSRSVNRWLSVRLQFIGSLIILSTALLAVWDQKKMSPATVGLIMSYALQITGSLTWIVRMTVEVETGAVCIERVLEYSSLPPEAPLITSTRPAAHWPTQGEISFQNYSTRYRDNLECVLKNISLEVSGGEKVGIVGRTGAGKSSLALAIFRLIEPVEGAIYIDKVDTSSLGLYDLRSRLSIIPQDSQVLEGSIRSNLDPLNQYSSEKLLDVLELSHLQSHVLKMAKEQECLPLDVAIQEGGSNLSVGQKQLVCLARALLNPSKVLVLDEATSSVDLETDNVVQQTIRAQFQGKTILTIAHRLDTVMDSDKIVVLDQGKIVEVGAPDDLLEQKGWFYEMVNSSHGNKE